MSLVSKAPEELGEAFCLCWRYPQFKALGVSDLEDLPAGLEKEEGPQVISKRLGQGRCGNGPRTPGPLGIMSSEGRQEKRLRLVPKAWSVLRGTARGSCHAHPARRGDRRKLRGGAESAGVGRANIRFPLLPHPGFSFLFPLASWAQINQMPRT